MTGPYPVGVVQVPGVAQRAVRALVGIAAVVVCAACSGATSAPGGTQTQSAGTTASSVISASPTAPSVVVALTASQAAGALPGTAQLPKGWAADPKEAFTANFLVNEHVTPTRCQSIVAALAVLVPYLSPTSAQTVYSRGQYGPFLNVVVSSHSPAPTSQQLTAVADAFAACPSFAIHDQSGAVGFRVHAARWSPATKTYVAQLVVTQQGQNGWTDLVLTESGPTIVEAWDSTAGVPEAALVSAVARSTVARLPT